MTDAASLTAAKAIASLTSEIVSDDICDLMNTFRSEYFSAPGAPEAEECLLEYDTQGSSDDASLTLTAVVCDEDGNEFRRNFRVTVEPIGDQWQTFNEAGRTVPVIPADGQYASFAPLAEFMANTRRLADPND
jgi:hypothetical protein